MNASENNDGNVSVLDTWPKDGARMIEDIDQRLMAWVGTVLTDTVVSLSPPVDEGGKPLVSLYLLDLYQSPPAQGSRRRPLQILLRYLVTTSAVHPEEAHSMLWTLVFSAMEEPEFGVDLESLSPSLWRAFGVMPRPAFMLRVPLRLQRPDEDVRLVRSPLEIHPSPMASLRGVLMGPEEMPIADARVELPAFHLATRTDASGRFWFAAVPDKSAVQRFHIKARGQEFVLETKRNTGDQEPLIIHINPGEV